MKKFFALLVGLSLWAAQVQAQSDYVAEIQTSHGNIFAMLFDRTPKHKANFVRLAEKGYYDGLQFHRLLEQFAIQGGDPNTRSLTDSTQLGLGGPGYELEAEVLPRLRHTRGSLGAARMGDRLNPKRKSSGSQFYILQTEAPHLDGEYTVFGKVLQGMEVVDKIAQLPVNAAYIPEQPVVMHIKMHYWSLRKIQKRFGKAYTQP